MKSEINSTSPIFIKQFSAKEEQHFTLHYLILCVLWTGAAFHGVITTGSTSSSYQSQLRLEGNCYTYQWIKPKCSKTNFIPHENVYTEFKHEFIHFSQFSQWVQTNVNPTSLRMFTHRVAPTLFCKSVIISISSTFSGSGEMQPFCYKLNESFIDKTVIAASHMKPKIFILFNNQTL